MNTAQHTRTVISRSAKRKTIGLGKYFTEMVVYKSKRPDGKYTSVTKHEIVPK